MKADQDRETTMFKWVFWLLAIVIIALAVSMALGCDSFKHFTGSKSDTTHVDKKNLAVVDTSAGGSVKKEDTKTHEENEWFKLTLQYLQSHPNGDTTITNNNYYPQPATVIYEGGKGSKDEHKSTIDSTFYFNIMRMIAASTDSMSRKIDNYEKTKKVEAVGFKWIPMILVLVGLFVLYEVYKGFKSKYQLVKKVQS